MESQGKHIIKIRKTILRELKKDDQREARKNEPKRLNVCVCACVCAQILQLLCKLLEGWMVGSATNRGGSWEQFTGKEENRRRKREGGRDKAADDVESQETYMQVGGL